MLWPGQVSQADYRRLANVPGGLGDAALIDHGKIFLSHNFQQVSRRLGINIRYAPPYTPEFKGYVERFFSTANARLWQHLHHYTSSNVTHRGRRVGRTPVFALLMSELRQMWWEWVMLDYHNRPHDGCRLVGAPAQAVSPKQKFEEGMRRGGFVTAPPDPYIAVELLNPAKRVIRRPAIMIDNLPYWSEILDPWAKQKGRGSDHPYPSPLPGRKVPEEHIFRRDPDDPRAIWFQHPVERTWHEIPCPLLEDVEAPFGRGMVRYAKRLMLGEGQKVTPERLAFLVKDMLDRWSHGLPRTEQEANAVQASLQRAQRARVVLPRDTTDTNWLRFGEVDGGPLPLADGHDGAGDADVDERAFDLDGLTPVGRL